MLGHRRDAAPERFHFLTENAARGFNEPFRRKKMRRAARMHINRRAKLGKAPRRAGVVEMDVAQECMAHVRGRETNLVERRRNVAEGGFWSDIEQRESVDSFDSGCGDNSRPAQHFCV